MPPARLPLLLQPTRAAQDPCPRLSPQSAPLPEDDKVAVLWRGPSILPPKPFTQRGSRILLLCYKMSRIRQPDPPPVLPAGLTCLHFAVGAAVRGVPALLYFLCIRYSPRTAVLAGEEHPGHTPTLSASLSRAGPGCWVPGEASPAGPEPRPPAPL